MGSAGLECWSPLCHVICDHVARDARCSIGRAASQLSSVSAPAWNNPGITLRSRPRQPVVDPIAQRGTLWSTAWALLVPRDHGRSQGHRRPAPRCPARCGRRPETAMAAGRAPYLPTGPFGRRSGSGPGVAARSGIAPSSSSPGATTSSVPGALWMYRPLQAGRCLSLSSVDPRWRA